MSARRHTQQTRASKRRDYQRKGARLRAEEAALRDPKRSGRIAVRKRKPSKSAPIVNDWVTAAMTLRDR